MDIEEIIKAAKELSDAAAEYLPHLRALTAADLLFAFTYYRKIRWRIKKFFRFCFMLFTLILIVMVMASWKG